MASVSSDTGISHMCHLSESLHYTHTDVERCGGNPPTDHGAPVAEFVVDMRMLY